MTYEKKFKWTLTGLIVMIALNAFTLIMLWNNNSSATEWRQPEDQNEDFSDRGSARKFLQNRLGLNDVQSDTISAIQRRQFREMRTMRDELETMRRDYLDSLIQGNIDQGVLDSMANELGNKSATIEKSMSEHMIEVNQYLNMQQRQEFGQMMQDMLNHNRGRNGHNRNKNREYRNRQN